MLHNPELGSLSAQLQKERGIIESVGLRLQEPRRSQVRSLMCPLPSKKDEIIAVRSTDVLELLQNLVDGEIKVNRPKKESYVAKGKYFYMTAVGSHSFYKERKELELYTPEKGLQAIYENASHYGAQVAQLTAFARIISPLLKGDWRKSIIKYHTDKWTGMTDTTKTSMTDTIAIEEFVSDIFDDIGKLNSEIGSDVTVKQIINRSRFEALKTLFGLSERVDPNKLLLFLIDVYTEREGVIIGFNKGALQGNLYSWAVHPPRDRGAAHSDDEILVKSDLIQLFPKCQAIISAIEPLGVYEENILKELRLIQ